MRKLILLVVFLITIGVSACGSTSHKGYNLPINARNVRRIGNGWITFELGERTFLYRRYESITQLK